MCRAPHRTPSRFVTAPCQKGEQFGLPTIFITPLAFCINPLASLTASPTRPPLLVSLDLSSSSPSPPSTCLQNRQPPARLLPRRHSPPLLTPVETPPEELTSFAAPPRRGAGPKLARLLRVAPRRFEPFVPRFGQAGQGTDRSRAGRCGGARRDVRRIGAWTWSRRLRPVEAAACGCRRGRRRGGCYCACCRCRCRGLDDVHSAGDFQGRPRFDSEALLVPLIELWGFMRYFLGCVGMEEGDHRGIGGAAAPAR